MNGPTWLAVHDHAGVTVSDGPPRRFRRAPLRWVGAAALFLVLYAILTLTQAATRNRPFRDPLRVGGSVLEAYDGRALSVPISYLNAVTGRSTTVTLRVTHYDERPRAGGTIAIEVGRDDPGAVRMAGSHTRGTSGWVEMSVLAAALSLGPSALRAVTINRTRHLVGASTPSFAMRASLTTRRRGRRPLLCLYALDVDPGRSAPICIVPLDSTGGQPIDGPVFNVDVKGVPRPFGLIVARMDSGHVLWPAARALAVTKRRGAASDLGVGRHHDTSIPDEPSNPPFRLGDWRDEIRGLLIAVAVMAAIATTATVVTLNHRRHDRLAISRSVPGVADIKGRKSQNLIVEFAWHDAIRRSSVPVNRDHHYFLNVAYPVRIDPITASAIRMSADPYDAVRPILWPWLVVVILSSNVAYRLFRRRAIGRACARGPVQHLVATAERGTPRTIIVTLTATGDPAGAHHGMVLLSRSSTAARALSERRSVSVDVWGNVDDVATPVLVIGETAYLPVSRIVYGAPLFSWPRPRSRKVKNRCEGRR